MYIDVSNVCIDVYSVSMTCINVYNGGVLLAINVFDWYYSGAGRWMHPSILHPQQLQGGLTHCVKHAPTMGDYISQLCSHQHLQGIGKPTPGKLTATVRGELTHLWYDYCNCRG
jgi:hypothetical protein